MFEGVEIQQHIITDSRFIHEMLGFDDRLRRCGDNKGSRHTQGQRVETKTDWDILGFTTALLSLLEQKRERGEKQSHIPMMAWLLSYNFVNLLQLCQNKMSQGGVRQGHRPQWWLDYFVTTNFVPLLQICYFVTALFLWYNFVSTKKGERGKKQGRMPPYGPITLLLYYNFVTLLKLCYSLTILFLCYKFVVTKKEKKQQGRRPNDGSITPPSSQLRRPRPSSGPWGLNYFVTLS